MSTQIEILPVFISSTWIDLRPEHEAAERAVNSMRETKYAGMKYFGARDEDTRTASLDEVDRSRVYVGIIGGRYGSGITEAEYDRATARGLRRFVYFKSDASTPADARDTDHAELAKLAAFKQKLSAAHTVKEFTTPDDLTAQVTSNLYRWLIDEYLTPKLQGALGGTVPHEEAQALLTAVKDLSALNRDLVTRLQSAGFNIASGERSAAVSGDRNRVVTGDANVLAENVAGDVVQGDKIIHEAPRPIIPTLHQLRAPVGDFVGREKEIDQLLAALRGGASAAISGISGMGGIGKTELAFYVAERLRGVYTDAQLVVDMRGTDDTPRDAGDALAACIRAFVGLEQRLPDDLQELTRIYRSVLEGRHALILLDNARDSAQTRPLMPPAGSALLVTSREMVALPGMTRVTLEQLEPAKARELLRRIAPHVPADTADRICFLCGYLPLAIRAAGSLLDITRDLAPDAYAEELQDERRRLELIGKEGVDLDVGASFGLSYDRLMPDAARVFRQLAVFPASFGAPAEEIICEDPDHKQLSELLRRNLVRYNEETQRYSLHDLARLFAASRMSDDERHATRMRHSAHYLTVLGECNDFYLKGGDAIKSGLALFDVERRNIEAGQEWTCQHSSEDELAAGLCNKYPNAGIYILNLRQHPRESVSWLEVALASAHQLKERVFEGKHLGNLGVAYADLGEMRRAIEFQEQALVVLREIGDRGGEGVALSNLGGAYADLGEMNRAVELHKQALMVSREIGDRREEENALGNLGTAYADLGEMRHALKFYEQALVIAREIGDRRGEGYGLGNLGITYEKMGETRRAVELYEQSLAIKREIGDRRGEANTLFNIGLMLNTLGDRAEAIAHAEAALEIYKQIESPAAKKARALLARWRGEA
ncbi:MAG TPA: tetratricopeptide repeat protein [Pyrinomonadaceae bacterium]|nr:tetratricopeptide repeat protein [Pyrinomonadaceae bacterium]